MKECCNTCRFNIDNECTVEPLSRGHHPAIIPANIADKYRCSQYVSISHVSNLSTTKQMLVEGMRNE